MSLEVRCGQCDKRYSVKESLAGKKLRCKACGGVIVVPPLAAAQSPAPTRGPAATPPRPRTALQTPVRKPPIAPIEPEEPTVDPFAEALASAADLEAAESSGEVDHANAPYDAALVNRPRGPAYVALSGEETIDRLVPWGLIALFVIFIFVAAWRACSDVADQADRLHLRPGDKAASIGRVCGWALGILIGVAAVAAPLHLAGVWLASRVAEFRNRSWLFLKCIAVASVPWTVALLITGFSLSQSWWSPMFFAGVPVAIGVMWLLLRLKPAPFAMAAGLAMMLGVALPALVGRSMGRPELAATGTPTTPTANKSSIGSLTQGGAPADPNSLPDRLTDILNTINTYASDHAGRYPVGLEEINRGDLLTVTGPNYGYRIFTTLSPRWRAPLPPTLIVAMARPWIVDEAKFAPFSTAIFADGTIKAFKTEDEQKAAEAASAEAERQLQRKYVEVHVNERAPEPPLLDRSTAKGVAQAWYVAYETADAATEKDLTFNVSPDLIDITLNMIAARRQMQDAAAVKFLGTPGAPDVPKSAAEVAHDMRDLKPVVAPDGQTATAGNFFSSVSLKKIDGQWKVDGQRKFLAIGREAQIRTFMINLRIETSAIAEVTQEIQDGKYPSFADAEKAVTTKSNEARKTDSEYLESLKVR